MIAIINYGMGNLQSVANILEYLKAPARITNNAEEIRDAEKLILPGVGAFNEAMMNLEQLGLISVIRECVLEDKKPFLGICLGMQLMADTGYEGGKTSGLGLIPGEVRLMRPADTHLLLPHVGWNDVAPRSGTALYGDNLGKRVFYFVHSFAFFTREDQDISGICYYGGQFIASIERGHIFGTQFHPEKSQRDGIDLLKFFLAYA